MSPAAKSLLIDRGRPAPPAGGEAPPEAQETRPLMAPSYDPESAEKAATAPPPACAQVSLAILSGVAYIAASAAMILFNKFLMREDRFPFAPFLTLCHQLAVFVLSAMLYRTMPSLFPSFSKVFPFSADSSKTNFWDYCQTLLPFVPLAACGMVSLVAGNWAYRYASVAFLQMIKESHIIYVYFLMVVFGLDKLRLLTVGIIVFIAAAAIMAVYGEARFSLAGLLLQLSAGLFGAMQIVLTNRMMSHSGGLRVDPLTMVLCTAPVMFLFLVPSNFALFDARLFQRLPVWYPYLGLSCLLAFTLQITMAFAIRTLSATGHAIASVIKDVGIVLSSCLLLGDTVTQIQGAGFAGCVVGISLYSATKLFPGSFFGASPPPPPPAGPRRPPLRDSPL